MGLSEIKASIRYGFCGLTRFSGRDTRRQFWPYAIFLYLAASVLGAAAMMVGMMRLIFAQMVPDETGAIPETTALFEYLPISAGVAGAIMILLLAAAVTRRLHDSNMRGYWGLMPIPSLVVGLIAMPTPAGLAGESPEAATDRILFLFANNVIYLGLLALLLALLARKTDRAANRFGPPPPL